MYDVSAILSSMISAKSDYTNVSVSRIPVKGEIIPVLDGRVLKAEDAAFLAQALYDRASVLSGWPRSASWSPGNMNPVDTTATDFSLVPEQEGRRSIPEIAKLFHAAAYDSGVASEAYEYMRYVDPSVTKMVKDKILADGRFTDLVPSKKFRTIETNLLEELGMKESSFAAKARNRPDAEWESRSLGIAALRNAYSDVKNLRRLIVPCRTTSSATCRWQESKYDQDPNTGSTYSADLVVKPVSQRPTFDFSVVKCFCTVPSGGDSTSTLYMSGKSVYYTSESGKAVSTCCADWIDVTPSGRIELEPTCGCAKGRLEVERIYVIVRAWRWNLTGIPYDTLDAKTYLTSVGTTKWEIPEKTFSLAKCREYLSKVGFPTECARQHDGDVSKRHFAKVGVDVVGIYALAHLKDPPVKTDIWNLGWEP